MRDPLKTLDENGVFFAPWHSGTQNTFASFLGPPGAFWLFQAFERAGKGAEAGLLEPKILSDPFRPRADMEGRT